MMSGVLIEEAAGAKQTIHEITLRNTKLLSVFRVGLWIVLELKTRKPWNPETRTLPHDGSTLGSGHLDGVQNWEGKSVAAPSTTLVYLSSETRRGLVSPSELFEGAPLGRRAGFTTYGYLTGICINTGLILLSTAAPVLRAIGCAS
jgi:hypothetical protein